jgi:ferredoxin-type protein NapH
VAFPRRWIFQGLGALLPNSYIQGFLSGSLYQGPLKSVCTPVLNCYACPSALFSCPIGTMQHFAATGSVPFYAVGTVAVIGASVGRMTCGTLCPFGFLQDLLYRVRSRKMALPLASVLRYMRYAALALLVFLVPYLTRESWFSKLCPAGTLMGGLPWAVLAPDVRAMIGTLFWVKLVILLAFVAASVPVKRPFCRTACPLGAILSLFNRVSFVQLAWNSDTCIDCGKCREVCPVDIRPDRDTASPECIRCLDCLQCPSLKVTTILDSDPFGRRDPLGAALPGREEPGYRAGSAAP